MTKPNKNARNKHITLYPTDEKIVEVYMERSGATFSQAIRAIIREWSMIVNVSGEQQPCQAGQ